MNEAPHLGMSIIQSRSSPFGRSWQLWRDMYIGLRRRHFVYDKLSEHGESSGEVGDPYSLGESHWLSLYMIRRRVVGQLPEGFDE